MTDDSRLRMPEHTVAAPNEDGTDGYKHGDPPSYICRASRVGGYALVRPDGKLHCNRCGWVTPEPVVLAWHNDRHYLTWDELVEAEANGYVVVSTSTRPGTVPAVNGPYKTEREAKTAQRRVRNQAKKHESPHKVRTYIRVLWP